jgi:hypothetical protein
MTKPFRVHLVRGGLPLLLLLLSLPLRLRLRRLRRSRLMRPARPSGRPQFFDKLPIHRELISITKRHTSRNNSEFNLRHDWNAMLDHPEPPTPMAERTLSRYPQASLLAEYIREFAAPQDRDGFIQYRTEVRSISRHTGPTAFANTRFAGDGGGGFDLDLEVSSDSAATCADDDAGDSSSGSSENGGGACHTHKTSSSCVCGVVVMAAGIDVPTSPGIDGFLRAGGRMYDTLPPTGEIFEGKRVAIIGLGNAAFETAMAAEDYASFVHFFYAHHGRSGWGWPQLSWETRYVGSPRAARLKPLDAYLLKSLDGFVPRSHVDRGQNKSAIATMDTTWLSASGAHVQSMHDAARPFAAMVSHAPS